jgi:hypothetical protein
MFDLLRKLLFIFFEVVNFFFKLFLFGFDLGCLRWMLRIFWFFWYYLFLHFFPQIVVFFHQCCISCFLVLEFPLSLLGQFFLLYYLFTHVFKFLLHLSNFRQPHIFRLRVHAHIRKSIGRGILNSDHGSLFIFLHYVHNLFPAIQNLSFAFFHALSIAQFGNICMINLSLLRIPSKIWVIRLQFLPR